MFPLTVRVRAVVLLPKASVPPLIVKPEMVALVLSVTVPALMTTVSPDCGVVPLQLAQVPTVAQLPPFDVQVKAQAGAWSSPQAKHSPPSRHQGPAATRRVHWFFNNRCIHMVF
jgi:hypothetical protein